MSCQTNEHDYSVAIYREVLVSSYQPTRQEIASYACRKCGDRLRAFITEEEDVRENGLNRK